MTTADFASTHRPVSLSLAPRVGALVRWFAARHETGAKSAALRDLLLAPESRLRDLGISREELVGAIGARRRPTTRN